MGNYNIGFIPLIAILGSILFEINPNDNREKEFKIKQKNLIKIFLIFYLSISLFQTYKIYQVVSNKEAFYNRDTKIINSIKQRSLNLSTPFIVDGSTALLVKRAGFTNLISLDHAEHLANGKAKIYSGNKFLVFLKNKNMNKIPYLLLNSNKQRDKQYSSNKKRYFLRSLKSINEDCLYKNNFCSGYISLENKN